MKGNVKFFNSQKGFGFITGEDEKDYFVHITKIADEKTLEENEAVEFDPSQNDRGLAADNVRRLSAEGEAASEPEAESESEEVAEEAE